MLKELQHLNPGLPLFSVSDPFFSIYGRVLELDTQRLLEAANLLPRPKSGTLYTPSEQRLEACGAAATAQEMVFGRLPMQMGYCCGHNDRLNALEWHACSEINIAVTPLVLLLGKRQDIWGNRYDAGLVRGFLLEPGQAVELYATSLHFTPCQVETAGFGCIVGLIAGTNCPLEEATGDPLLYGRNKWLLAHEDNKALIDKGGRAGIYGDNIQLKGV